jgi:hypothetical protein
LYQTFQNLKENCKNEKQKKVDEMKNAQKFEGEERTEKILTVQKMELKSCTKLKEFKKLISRQ